MTLYNLTPSTTYYLKARSIDRAGNSTESIRVTFTTPSSYFIVATDAGNNLTMFSASGASNSVKVPIEQVGQTHHFDARLDLGEIHFSKGKTLIVLGSGLTGPPPSYTPAGGLAIVDIANLRVDDVFGLPSDLTGRESRLTQAFLNPEGTYLWIGNDGPDGGPEADSADSVFKVNVNPADANPTTGYRTSTEILLGNGRHAGAFSRPSILKKKAKKLFVVTSEIEQRIDVIDDDAVIPTTSTYGTVVKTIRHLGGNPRGIAYSNVSGRFYVGLSNGGVVTLDATKLDLNNDGTVDVPDFDCAANNDCDNSAVDPSVAKIPPGTGPNQIPAAGYTRVSADGKTVFTVGYDSTAGKSLLSAIDAGNNDAVLGVVELPDVGVASLDEKAGDKLYLPGNNVGAKKNVIAVVDINPSSASYLTVIGEITVGDAAADRHGEVSTDGRVAVYPDTCAACNTVQVIETATDSVVDTLTLPGPSAKTVGMVRVPVTATENH
jgi:hypothetical protein